MKTGAAQCSAQHSKSDVCKVPHLPQGSKSRDADAHRRQLLLWHAHVIKRMLLLLLR